jgi:hypothetical protein
VLWVRARFNNAGQRSCAAAPLQDLGAILKMVIADTPTDGFPLRLAAERLLQLKDISLLVGLSGSSIYRLIAAGRFPTSFNLDAVMAKLSPTGPSD